MEGEEEIFESLDESKAKCGYFERLEHTKTIHHKRHYGFVYYL